ncbi:MAG: hypothetical protein ACR2IF_00085 [Terriglobales bacterium]
MGSGEPREQSRDVTPEANLSFGTNRLHPVADNVTEPPKPAKQPGADTGVSRTTIWLHRLSLVIFVIFCIELGMVLAALPWTRVWSDNSLVAAHPAWRTILHDNFVRGVVTGLGLVDIWIGIWEAVHYRDPGKKKIS